MSRPEWDKLGRFTAKLAEHARKFSDLSMLQVLSPIPLPAGHPDLDDFDADLADCLEYALAASRREYGIWGGTSVKERDEIKQQRRLRERTRA